MVWIPVKSKRIEAVSYDSAANELLVRFKKSRPARHVGVTSAMFDNLVETKDPDFYYTYYIEPGRVSPHTVASGMAAKTFSVVLYSTLLYLIFPLAAGI